MPSERDAYAGELAWLRAEVGRALLDPRRFSRTLPAEARGLASVLVAVVAGFLVSAAIDVGVLAERRAPVTAYLDRIALQGLAMGASCAILSSAVAWLLVAASRLIRGRADLDQVVTAVSFALVPLPLAVAPLPLVGFWHVLWLPASVVGVLLVARTLYGLALNLRAVLVPGLAIAAFGLTLLGASWIMRDQGPRVQYVVSVAAAPPIVGPAPGGERFDMFDFDITLPPGWRNETIGSDARFVSPDRTTTVTVGRGRLDPFSTLVDFADLAGPRDRSGLSGVTALRSIVLVDGRPAVDDRFSATGRDGRRVVGRFLCIELTGAVTTVSYRAVDPAEDARAWAEAAGITASIAFGR